MKISKYILSVLNAVNAFSMLMFIPFSVFGNDAFKADLANGKAVQAITFLQVAVALSVGLTTGIYAEARKIKGENDGFAIIKESSKKARFAVCLFGLADIITAVFVLKNQVVLYLFVCFMHAMCVMYCSRIIKRI